MKKIKSTSLTVISLLTNITYFLTLLGLVLVLALNILAYTDVLYPEGDSESGVSINIPLSVELKEVGVYKTNTGLSELNLSTDDSKLTFKNPPKKVIRISSLFLLISLGVTFYLIYLFRKFIINVKNNNVFVSENSSIFKKLGIGIFVLWGIKILSSFVVSLLVTSNVKFESADVSSKFVINFDFTLIIFSLFLIVLSHIFSQGIRLQEEKDLTI